MRLPKKADVVGSVYSIHVETRPVANPLLDERPLAGCCAHSQRAIVLDGMCDDEMQCEVLTHELLHAIDRVTTSHDDQLEERHIHRLARGLHYVLSKNPEYVHLYAVRSIRPTHRRKGST